MITSGGLEGEILDELPHGEEEDGQKGVVREEVQQKGREDVRDGV